jgi:hypothetical protein
MTKEEIIRMAREAGFRFSDEEDPLLANHAEWQRRLFERFAAQVALAEREACANLAEETVCDTHLPTGVKIYGWRVSKAIRARSTP